VFVFEVGAYRFEEFEEQGIGLPNLGALSDLCAVDLHEDQFNPAVDRNDILIGRFGQLFFDLP